MFQKNVVTFKKIILRYFRNLSLYLIFFWNIMKKHLVENILLEYYSNDLKMFQKYSQSFVTIDSFLTLSGYRFFGPFWSYRGSFQTQGMSKRSIINKKSGKIPVHSWALLL